MVYYYLIWNGGIMTCILIDTKYPVPDTTVVNCGAHFDYPSEVVFVGKCNLTCSGIGVVSTDVYSGGPGQ